MFSFENKCSFNFPTLQSFDDYHKTLKKNKQYTYKIYLLDKNCDNVRYIFTFILQKYKDLRKMSIKVEDSKGNFVINSPESYILYDLKDKITNNNNDKHLLDLFKELYLAHSIFTREQLSNLFFNSTLYEAI